MRNFFPAVEAAMPGWMNQSVAAIATGAIAVVIALIVHRIFFRILQRVVQSSESATDDLLVQKLARPTRYAMIALGLVLAAREIPALAAIWQRVAAFVMPALIGWIALSVLHALVKAMEMHTDTAIALPDNRDARRKRTRLAIFSRIATFLIIFLTIGLMLLSIPGVRDIGVTLMASAGLAGLAVGAAAQPALKSLIAGFQMALTEPISIDDVVIIDGEWGRVEDIRTTYVVVRLWDERRLVVPTSKFLEETFQNWTRESTELLGYIYLHLEPLAEIAPIRAEFERQAKAHHLWDGRVCKLQVTETSPQSIEVRLLMSAADASQAFELRCDIRESMLAWIRENQPEAIVRRRIEPTLLEAAVDGGASDT
jgi:small-conductance mechanosensitive channel